MDVLDALSRHEGVRHVTTRHEQGAAFMADVHGRLTGRAAVAMATLGPGATNLITGVADAFLDRAPMVAITGQAASSKLHKEAHQVVDIVRMLEPVTKWNTRVGAAELIPEIVRKAFRVATLEKPGPTHIELPEDIAAATFSPDAPAARAADPGACLLPGADRRGHRPRRSPDRGLGTADHPGRQRHPSSRRRARVARARARAACSGRGHVHGQGRDRRPVAPVADGRRPAGARPRPVRVRPGRPRHLRRVRPRGVRAVVVGSGRLEAGHPHRHAAGRDRRGVPPRGRAHRRHRWVAAAAARGRPAAGRRRARRVRAARLARDPRPRRPADAAARRAAGARVDRRLADHPAARDR